MQKVVPLASELYANPNVYSVKHNYIVKVIGLPSFGPNTVFRKKLGNCEVIPLYPTHIPNPILNPYP